MQETKLKAQQEKALIFEIKKLKEANRTIIKNIKDLQRERENYNKLKNSMVDKGKSKVIKINIEIGKLNKKIENNIIEIQRLSFKIGVN